MPEKHPPWQNHIVEGVADVLGETDGGLTGSQISALLATVGVPDVALTETKRHRIRHALLAQQAKNRAANCVIRFITEAMQPARYRNDPALFTARQDALNEVVVFLGLRVNDDGKLQRGAKATTLGEAAQHANSIRAELRRRGVHAEVLRYCSREVLERNPFHASLEAAKSVPDRLRQMTGFQADGAPLIDATLSLGRNGVPRVAINALATESERDEQTGRQPLQRIARHVPQSDCARSPHQSRSQRRRAA